MMPRYLFSHRNPDFEVVVGSSDAQPLAAVDVGRTLEGMEVLNSGKILHKSSLLAAFPSDRVRRRKM